MRRKILALLSTAAVAASGLVFAAGGPADAQRVDNTGPGQLVFDLGNLKVGSQEFDTGAGGDQVVASFPSVSPSGNFTLSGIVFPPIEPVEGPLGNVNVTIQFNNGSGSVNPLTGAATFNLSININLSGGGAPSGCTVGPIVIAASTATLGGVPYNPVDGRVTLADRTFSVPGSSGCGLVGGTVNDQVGIPSPSGNNFAVFGGFFSPVRNPAVRPSFTVTPSTDFAPVNATLDASGTYTARPNPTYQWDFQNDGSFDATGVTAAHTYAAPGTYTARLRVTDDQGDAAETTRTVTVLTPLPDVTLDKSGPSALIHGETGTYTLSVGTEGQLPSSGAQVVDTLPAGLSFAGYGGAGWTCAEALGVVTCDSVDIVAPGGAFPDLTIDALADGTVTGVVTNAANVTTPGEADTADNADGADTQLIQPGIDLEVAKVHDADQGLFVGERATYTISVENKGTEPTNNPILLTDELPAGTTFVGGSGGTDWICTQAANVVNCFSLEVVAPGESLDDVRIVVDVDPDAPASLSNTATISTDGDANSDNDSATDTGDVLGIAVDYEITKVHVGDLVAGETASYGIGVRNVGTTPGGGTVTVTDDLPAGLTYVGATGDGWSCGAAGQLVTCTHAGGVEPGDFLPGITMRVVADASAVGPVTNTASVSGANDVNPANDSDSDPGTVRLPAPDLALTKSHVGNFVTQANGTWTLSVRNLSTDRADGPTTVVDTLPAGVSYVSAGGTGWSCGAVGQTVTCTYAGVIAGLATAPPISVVAFAPDGAPATVVNNASVSQALDGNGANDAASDPTRIDRRPTAATVLEAQPLLIGLTTKGGIPKLTLLGAPHATLTKADGTPIAGKTVTFRPFNRQEVICTAVTDAKGVARCTDGLSVVLALSQLRYHADFDGDLDYKPSHDEAALVLLGLVKLL